MGNVLSFEPMTICACDLLHNPANQTYQIFNIRYDFEKPQKLRKRGFGKEFRWVINTLARGPQFGPNVLPILLPHFPSTAQVLHFASWQSGSLETACASFGTTPTTYI
jgi:hypothetical protein